MKSPVIYRYNVNSIDLVSVEQVSEAIGLVEEAVAKLGIITVTEESVKDVTSWIKEESKNG
jgi:hypothetical protein